MTKEPRTHLLLVNVPPVELREHAHDLESQLAEDSVAGLVELPPIRQLPSELRESEPADEIASDLLSKLSLRRDHS